ncbi:MAG: hypothetical protein AB7T49_10975 [Oligoflexales bacterium]
MTTRRWRTILIQCFVLLAASSAFAQSRGNDQREEFQEAYKDQKSTRSSFLGGAPSYSLTPRRDNVGFAIGFEPVDVRVKAADSDETSGDNTLDMTGYTLLPTVAFFRSMFGIGISGEVGKRTIEYLQQVDPTTTEEEYFYEQYSETDYVGAGIYGYMLLPKKMLPRIMRGTVIIGGRSLTVDVKSRGTRTTPETMPDFTKLKYDVNMLEGGLHFTLTLAKRYQIIPWLNYRATSVGSIKDENQSSDDISEEVIEAAKLDQKLIWQSNADIKYGFDFAVQFTNLDIHFGGLLGYLANLNRGAERIQDKGLFVSASYYIAPPEE